MLLKPEEWVRDMKFLEYYFDSKLVHPVWFDTDVFLTHVVWITSGHKDFLSWVLPYANT